MSSHLMTWIIKHIINNYPQLTASKNDQQVSKTLNTDHLFSSEITITMRTNSQLRGADNANPQYISKRTDNIYSTWHIYCMPAFMHESMTSTRHAPWQSYMVWQVYGSIQNMAKNSRIDDRWNWKDSVKKKWHYRLLDYGNMRYDTRQRFITSLVTAAVSDERRCSAHLFLVEVPAHRSATSSAALAEGSRADCIQTSSPGVQASTWVHTCIPYWRALSGGRCWGSSATPF